MVKIAIVELEGHVECLYSFLNFLQIHDDEVHVFTSQKIFKELNPAADVSFHFHILDRGQSKAAFLNRNISRLNSCDAIFFNSLQKDPHLYPFSEIKAPKFLRIHNMNTFFNRSASISLDWSPYALWKDFSYFLREYIIQRQTAFFDRFIAETDFIMLPDTHYEKFLVKMSDFPSEKIFNGVPMASYKTRLNLDEKDCFNIVITGTIDERRKDYLFAFECIKKVLTLTNQKIDLCLLGAPKGPYGNKVIQAFKSLDASNFQFTFFEQRIDQQTFEKYVFQADLLYAPIKIETRYKFFKEVYGKTKISGSWTDMIRYGKLLCLPDAYPLADGFHEFCLTYNNLESNVSAILELMNDQALLKLKSNALKTFLENNYSNSRLYTSFRRQLEQSIGNLQKAD